MIYTVTLNPSLDYIMHADALQLGLTNRSSEEEIYPGGKGINVSVMLSRLGQLTIATGFVAGFTGKKIANAVSKLDVTTRFTTLSKGFSRINVKLKGQSETEINAAGPIVQNDDFKKLLSEFNDLTETDYLVLSGSVPKGLSDDCYTLLMATAIQKGAKIVVDATGKTLLSTLPARPFLIKPNHQELCELFQVIVDPRDFMQVAFLAKQLQLQGARNVLVSLGCDGCLLLDEQSTVHTLPAAKGKVVNTVGSGDSMIAGFIAEYSRTGNYSKSLRLGVACGSATAFSPWLAEADTVSYVLSTLPSEQTFQL